MNIFQLVVVIATYVSNSQSSLQRKNNGGCVEVGSVQYLKQGHNSLMLAISRMFTQAARQRLVHVKLRAKKVIRSNAIAH